MSRRVIKLGGSLLARNDLKDRFFRWHNSLPPSDDVLIAGGGLLADGIRAYAARFGLSDETAHQCCLECMSSTSRVIAEVFGLPQEDAFDSLCERTHRLLVFDAAPFLRTVEPTLANPLPHDWTVSSDSIAARIARLLDAELILLKSANNQFPHWDTAAERGYVDRHFPTAIQAVRSVSVTNLLSNPGK